MLSGIFVSFRFQATGDHLPVAPPAPAHAQLAAVQAAQYNAVNAKSYESGSVDGFEDGQYDPRYNDPNFEGNLRGASVPASYNVQAQAQPQYVQQPQPAQVQPQAYNNLNNINYVAQYQSTTPNPHRFQPPGKRPLDYHRILSQDNWPQSVDYFRSSFCTLL